ncbi:dynein axonemal intermediate chain 3 [Ciona intestinalis]
MADDPPRTPTPSGSRKGSGKKAAPAPNKLAPPAAAAQKKSKESVTKSKSQHDAQPPQGIVPLFMATKSQEIYECICDEHVTEDNPYKLIKKADIIQDMKMRAAISDFHPVKQLVLDYPGEELLIAYDPDFKFGQNFFLCATEEAKMEHLHPGGAGAEGEEGVEAAGEEGAEEEDNAVYVYKPPEAKEWVTQGSQVEVEDEIVVDTRDKIRFRASRVRKEFGAAITFEDRDADTSAAEQGLAASCLACPSYADTNFTIKKAELDNAVQAVPEMTDGSSQTDWKHPVTASVQYEPRVISVEEAKVAQQSEEFKQFVQASLPRFELALQQNTIMDVFFDDWAVLGEEDTNFGSKSDSHLKEYQSFTDLQYSKDKTVTCVDWHPQIKGVMAVACCERLTFDERIDNANKLLMSPSLILIWSFADPIHPQLLLEGPDDICCFKFCPTNPNIVAGGCINGQLVLWDITEYSEKLSSNRGNNSKASQKKAAMFGEEMQPETPTIRYCAVSAIENSHRNIISSVDWLPDHYELNRFGIPVENRLSECCQIMTCGTDGHVMVWDIRAPKAPANTKDQQAEKSAPPRPFGVSQVFKHLDLSWKPLLKLSMAKTDSSGDYSPLKFSLTEKQGVRDHVPQPAGGKPETTGMSKVPSAKNQRPLECIATNYFLGSEDGEVIYASFKLEKDNETGKSNVPKPTWSVAPHDGPVNTLQRNPFFSDILLSVGGWTFAIWKEGVTSGAILQSACAPKLYTAGHWSTTRPAVFFLGTKDGNVEVWDLLDRTHEPLLVQNVTAAQVTQIVPWVVSKKQHLVAVSDNVGTLHILEIPWNLRHPASGEKQAVEGFFDREIQRIEYFDKKAVARANERSKEMDKKKAQQAKADEVSDDALMEEYKVEYDSYKQLEKKLLQQLGLIEEEKPEI